ncbi:hypothetical protein V493_02430 [Pseudogymnoascus sp. VKM F-4281 (FW-2241)]|nr:hypothetical protein V493_02430 [Pseudogymnoascus sp. VKM F-4281 (FW-2241)]
MRLHNGDPVVQPLTLRLPDPTRGCRQVSVIPQPIARIGAAAPRRMRNMVIHHNRQPLVSERLDHRFKDIQSAEVDEVGVRGEQCFGDERVGNDHLIRIRQAHAIKPQFSDRRRDGGAVPDIQPRGHEELVAPAVPVHRRELDGVIVRIEDVSPACAQRRLGNERACVGCEFGIIALDVMQEEVDLGGWDPGVGERGFGAAPAEEHVDACHNEAAQENGIEHWHGGGCEESVQRGLGVWGLSRDAIKE